MLQIHPKIKDLPFIIVLCMGHSGSRMLVNILHDSGVYMGRYRSSIGEDNYNWSLLLSSEEMKNAYLRYYRENNKEDIIELLINKFNDFQHELIHKPGSIKSLSKKLKFKLGISTIHVKEIPENLKAYGFKNVTGSVLIADALVDFVKDLGIEKNTYFIHLSRELGNWLQSGYKKGTKGIPRYIFDPRGEFDKPANRYLWFNSTESIVYLPNGEELDLLNISSDELIKHREYLESLLWANSNKRLFDLKDKVSNFHHVRFHEILEQPEKTADELSAFLGFEMKMKQRLDRSRVSKYISEQISEQSKILAVELGYN